jgi:predicted nuclease of predicted toxin-antitoxin system
LKILIDQNVSARLARLLTRHDATHASAMGWAELTNGDLLIAAEADGFEIFFTADKDIRYQQNLTTEGSPLSCWAPTNWESCSRTSTKSAKLSMPSKLAAM